MLPLLALPNALARAAASGTWRSSTRTPGRTLRLRGGLGSLQAMAVAGSTTALDTTDGGARVTSTDVVGGGDAPGERGLGALAAPVDGGTRDPLERVAEHVEPE